MGTWVHGYISTWVHEYMHIVNMLTGADSNGTYTDTHTHAHTHKRMRMDDSGFDHGTDCITSVQNCSAPFPVQNPKRGMAHTLHCPPAAPAPCGCTCVHIQHIILPHLGLYVSMPPLDIISRCQGAAQHQCTTSAGASGFNVPRAADGMARDHNGGGSTVVCHRQMAPVQFI